MIMKFPRELKSFKVLIMIVMTYYFHTGKIQDYVYVGAMTALVGMREYSKKYYFKGEQE